MISITSSLSECVFTSPFTRWPISSRDADRDDCTDCVECSSHSVITIDSVLLTGDVHILVVDGTATRNKFYIIFMIYFFNRATYFSFD